jgi:DNA-binding MarR family transcriptional regulator
VNYFIGKVSDRASIGQGPRERRVGSAVVDARIALLHEDEDTNGMKPILMTSHKRTGNRKPGIALGESVDMAMQEAGSLPSEAVRAYLRLHYASAIIIKKVDQHLAHWGLSVARYAILRLLLNKQAMTLSELSRSHVCVAGNMTMLIGRLERDGFVKRIPDRQDKRVTRVVLTAKGRRVTSEAVGPHRAFLEQLMAPLGALKVRALADSIDALAERAAVLDADKFE